MNKTLKTMISAFIFIVMLTVTGCNGGVVQQDEAISNEPVTLKFMWWGNEQRNEATLKVMELYQKANPHVVFETETYPNVPSLATQLAMATADQNMPDIIQVDYSFVFNYIKRDLIEPLDSYIASNTLDLTDVDPSFLLSGQWEGRQYAIPMGTNALAVAYDPAMFEQAGIPPLENGYTLDDLYQTMKQWREKKADADFYPLDNMFDISYWLRTKGETLYNSDGTGLGYTDSSMIEYLAMVKQWTDEKLLNPNVEAGSPTLGSNNALANGRTALFPMPSNQVVSLGQMAGRTIKLLNLPTYQGAQEGNFVKPSMFLVASSYSKHKEEAAKFISFFTANQEANDILRGDRGVPIVSAVSNRLMEQADEQSKQQYTHMNYVADHSSPIDPPAPSTGLVVNNAFQLTLNNVIASHLTPEEGARSFRAEAEKILGQGGGSQ